MLNVDDEQFLIATEAARLLGVSRVTFYQNYRDELQPFRVGKRKRLHYRRSDLMRLRSAEPVAKVA